MKKSTAGPVVAAFAAAAAEAPISKAEEPRDAGGLDRRDSERAWTIQAEHVANKLDLPGEETKQLVAAYTEARESYAASVSPQIEQLMAATAPEDGAARLRVGWGAPVKLGAQARESLEKSLKGFLAPDIAEKAILRLGPLGAEWDRMVHVIAEMNLGENEPWALEAVNHYVVKRGAEAAKFAENGAVLEMVREEGALQLALEKNLEAILTGAQMNAWLNGVVRGVDDDDRSIDDPRVQHRTYVFEEAGGIEIPYALFVPSTYDKSKPCPLLLTLHGLGRTHDWLMGYEGLLDYAERDGYVVASPLGYVRSGWYGSVENGRTGELSELDVMNVFRIVRDEFNIDSNRIYLWGHSMGGAGTYRLAEKHPDLWAGLGVAAAAPLVSPDVLESFAHIPILVLQGDEDGLVTISRKWVAKMKAIGMEHIYIEDPGGDHSLFISQNPDNLSTLFSFFNIVRKREPRPASD